MNYILNSLKELNGDSNMAVHEMQKKREISIKQKQTFNLHLHYLQRRALLGGGDREGKIPQNFSGTLQQIFENLFSGKGHFLKERSKKFGVHKICRKLALYQLSYEKRQFQTENCGAPTPRVLYPPLLFTQLFTLSKYLLEF